MFKKEMIAMLLAGGQGSLSTVLLIFRLVTVLIQALILSEYLHSISLCV